MLALLAALGAVGCAARAEQRPAGSASADGPLAVALMAGPERLVVVDPVRARVVRSVGLRSLAFSLAADAGTGLVLTAQAGGLAERSDDAVGLWDPRGHRPVRYVRLPRSNPGSICVSRDRAIVTHGWFENGALCASVVDPRSGRVVRHGAFPDGPGSVWTVCGRLYAERVSDRSVGFDDGGVRRTRWEIVAIDPGSLEVTGTPIVAPAPVTVFVGDAAGAYAVGVTPPEAPGAGDTTAPAPPRGMWVARVDLSSGAVGPPRALGVLQGTVSDVVLTDRAVLIATERDDPEKSGGIDVVDRRTLEPVATWCGDHRPSAMTLWRDRLLVVDGPAGMLHFLDARTGSHRGSVGLGVKADVAARIVVSERGRLSGR